MEDPPRFDYSAHVAIVRSRAYVAVLGIAVALRVAWIAAVPVVPVSDSCRYDVFAQNLAAGEGYATESGPTAYWPVGPSFLFSLCYRLFGGEHEQRFLPIAILNLVMGTASVALTMYIGRKWFSPRVGVVAGLLLALWPSQVQFTTVLNSETPMILFMLAALAIWMAPSQTLWLRAVLAGAFLAAASYMRPTALLLPLVFCIHPLLVRLGRIRTLAGAALMAGTMLILVLPWSVRNYRVFGQFVLISTNGGTNFWMGNNPKTTGGYQSPLPAGHFGSEVERDRELRDQALEYVRQDPWAFFKRTAVKAIRLHERESIGVVWNHKGLERCFRALSPTAQRTAIFGIKLLANGYWWAMLALALFGVVRLARQWPPLLWLTAPPVLLWAYFAAVHAVTVIQDRYHFAAIPFMATLAGFGVLRHRYAMELSCT